MALIGPAAPGYLRHSDQMTRLLSAQALLQTLAETTARLCDLTLSITRWRMHGQCDRSAHTVGNACGKIEKMSK